MTIRDQEKIRILELMLISGGLCDFAFTGDATFFQFLSMPYLLDILASCRSLTLTEEYKELRKLYNEVIKNVSQFMKESDIESPVEIFAMYICMYRRGFLSYQKDFQYDMSYNVLDLSKMQGLDVVLGRGYCRSIACMLDDIYHCYGFDSSVLLVQANAKNISSDMKYSLWSLPYSRERRENLETKYSLSEVFIGKLLVEFGDYLEFPNHTINVVSDGKNSMILDPTLDVLLYGDNARKFSVANDRNIKMINSTYNLQVESKIFASLKKVKSIYSFLKKDSISYEEYMRIYEDTYKTCMGRDYEMRKFYQDNCSLYEEIYNIGSNCDGELRRVFPRLSKKKR